MISKRSTSELCERNTFCGLAYYNARYAITSYRKNNRYGNAQIEFEMHVMYLLPEYKLTVP